MSHRDRAVALVGLERGRSARIPTLRRDTIGMEGRACARRSTAGGFTLIEVLAGVLILGIGLLAAVRMVLYGLHLAKLSIGRATGLATAMSVAVDPSPLLPADPFWTTLSGTAKGYLNGYWVERIEGPTETVASTLMSTVTTVNVVVDVYETQLGRLVASYNQRIVRPSW